MFILGALITSILGNTLTFYLFERSVKPEISMSDALWYSIISITTIGYGDYSASTAGARVGTIVFIVIIGLAAFSGFLGLLVNWVVEIHQKEIKGLADTHAIDHVMLINFPSESRVRQIIEEIRSDAQLKKCEVVVVTPDIEALPFTMPGVSFVRGSPIMDETLIRAGVERARYAIILSTSHSDPNSDSIVASIISVIEHLNKDVKTIAECLDERHALLFKATGCDSIIYSNRIVNNLIVQEALDTGFNNLIEVITSNAVGDTVFSTEVGGAGQNYNDIAKRMLDQNLNVLAIIRDNAALTDLSKFSAQKGDVLLYVGPKRLRWDELAGMAGQR